ncbi:DUF998 domain-containing protein [Stenotrophomonas mori]|nr:DUF998 domain-containing protein [Stenotrophomonas mori]
MWKQMVRLAGPAAVLSWLVALATFGARLPDYDQMRHPVSLLGAAGVPGADAFNLFGFLLPGALAVLACVGLLLRMPAGTPRALRVAAQMLLLSGLAFAAMGVFPLDAGDIGNRASQVHASLWLFWLVAFCTGAGALWLGARGQRGWRPLARLGLACALWMLCSAFLFNHVMPAAMAQRLAFLAWALWLALAARLLPD